MARAVARPPLGRIRVSRVPWITVTGRSQLAQRRGAVARGDDRVQLAQDPRADCGERSYELPGQLAQALLVGRVGGRADQLGRSEDALDEAVAVARRVGQHQAEGLQRRRPDPAAAGRRHDRDQRADPVGVLDRQRLADHPAHRDADHVRRLDPEVVHQADRVGGHVGEQVGGGRAAAEEEVDAPRHARLVEHGRAADVAVVEADDAEAALGQHRAELLVPGDHLRRQAHHQDQRLAVGVAHLLVGDLDAVAGRQALLAESGHPAEV